MTTGLVQVAGEVSTSAYVEIPEIVRKTILDIGYDSSANGFDGATCGVNVSIGQQSTDIYDGVSTSLLKLVMDPSTKSTNRGPVTKA